MMPFESLNTPPGLKRQLIVSGIYPIVFSRKSMCVKSSRFIIAPSLSAYANSSAGVSFDENMICFPSNPHDFASISSVYDEQSHPMSYSFNILSRYGFGVAFTAKYSLNPGFHENASLTAWAFFLMPASSYR